MENLNGYGPARLATYVNREFENNFPCFGANKNATLGLLLFTDDDFFGKKWQIPTFLEVDIQTDDLILFSLFRARGIFFWPL